MSLKINQIETPEQITLQVQKPSDRYFNELMRCACAPDLLRSGVFPNAKEVTESFGAYNAVRKHLWKQFPPNDEDVICVCVADGSTPRTALTFALRTKWNVISVDPNLRHAKFQRWSGQFKRLYLFAKKIQDCRFEAKKIVIVMVHPHVKIDDTLPSIIGYEQRAVVSMQCCVKQFITNKAPDIEYNDLGIWSPQRSIKVWRQV
jgi:hypothetical protein